MTHAEARRCLLLHCVAVDYEEQLSPAENEVLERGFLGMLRPYRGLIDDNFHQTMQALLIVGEELHQTPALDRKLVHAVWDTLFTARMWGMRPNQMLQSNKLIAADDLPRLESYLDSIERTMLDFLRGRPPADAVRIYAGHLYKFPAGGDIEFFVNLMNRALDDVENDCWDIITALGKIGPVAKVTIPNLRKRWETPAVREAEHAEYRQDIERAIQSIER
jgi:hypothetical protein